MNADQVVDYVVMTVKSALDGHSTLQMAKDVAGTAAGISDFDLIWDNEVFADCLLYTSPSPRD